MLFLNLDDFVLAPPHLNPVSAPGLFNKKLFFLESVLEKDRSFSKKTRLFSKNRKFFSCLFAEFKSFLFKR